MVGFKVLEFLPPKAQTSATEHGGSRHGCGGRGNAGTQRHDSSMRKVGLPKWSGQFGSPFFVIGWFTRASLFFRGDTTEFAKVFDTAPVRGATQEDR
jgi:hypothetical protein